MNDTYVRAFDIAEDDVPGRFTGFPSVYGVEDTYESVFDAGSFRKTLKDHVKKGFPIVWMHRPEEPIGLARLQEQERGPFVEAGDLDLDVQRGREVHSGMKKQYITQMSHRFQPVRQKIVETDGRKVVHFTEVRLIEISPVTMNFASNPEASIDSVRTEMQEQLDEVKARATRESRIVTLPRELTDGIERLERALGNKPRARTSGDHLRTLATELERLDRALTKGA
ncbi:MAG: HK97 family phage prohead protease [Dehalococcoidia bacterium]|jgi:hypothetical protein|nr:HK97 family phage prohead protease [Dehalococcoidia bacterium]